MRYYSRYKLRASNILDKYHTKLNRSHNLPVGQIQQRNYPLLYGNKTPKCLLCTVKRKSINRLKCLQPLTLDNNEIPDTHPVYLWSHNVILNELINFLYSYIKKKHNVDTIL
jgi:hypothetical protein